MKKLIQNSRARYSTAIFSLVLLAFFTLLPSIAFGDTTGSASDISTKGLVTCVGVASNPPVPGEVVCDFNSLVTNVNSLMKWFFVISIPISVGFFAYAGALFMTADPGKIKTAHGIFKNVLIGQFFILASWLIINTILNYALSGTFTGARTFIGGN